MTLTVGCIGAGYFATFQVQAWYDLPGVRITGLCDMDSARAMALLDQVAGPGHGIPVYASADEMLAARPVDIVDIATPPATHSELIWAALAARPQLVVCQKPFCGGLEAAQAATRGAAATGIPLAVHENVRFQPWYRAAREALQANRIGEVYQLTMRLRPGDGQGAEAYLARQPYFRDMPRFLIHETGIHWIDTFRFLLGEPDALFADLRRINPGIAGEDAGFVLLRFGGQRAVFDGNRNVDHSAENHRHTMGEFTAEGSDGTMTLDGSGRLSLRSLGSVETVELGQWGVDGFGAGCVRAFQMHILDFLTGQRPLETAAADYLRNIEIEESVYESAASGQVVTLDKSTKIGKVEKHA